MITFGLSWFYYLQFLLLLVVSNIFISNLQAGDSNTEVPGMTLALFPYSLLEGFHFCQKSKPGTTICKRVIECNLIAYLRPSRE